MSALNNPPEFDNPAVKGLLGTADSIAYRVAEIERHLHSYEHWFELATTPNGELHVADQIGDGSSSFVIDAGDDDWGAWVQILGSSDTPHVPGKVKYDLHEIFVEATERFTTYFVQVGFGESGAAALAADDYAELIYTGALGAGNPTPVTLKGIRHDAGTKAWARCKCPGQNTATINIYLGLHEYEG